MERHAYCMTVNGNLQVLKAALRLIDNPNNDIFILMDKNSSKQFQTSVRAFQCQYSKIIILPPIPIFWAGVSQIRAELLLLQAAIKQYKNYEYIHYMQGADLPLKSQKEIHDFFHKKRGMQFVEYRPDMYQFAKYKVNYYHFFVNNRFFRKNKLVKICNHGCAKVQEKLHWKRKRKEEIYAGSALFSITSDCAVYLLKNAKRILKQYRFTLAADEVWIQTELMQSSYREKMYCFEKTRYGNVRYILWDRKRKNHNSPYTFKSTDFDEIKHIAETTELCFARKFEEKEDMEIVCKIEELIKGERKTDVRQMQHPQYFYEKYVKRPQDFCLAFGAILVLSPVMAVTAILVKTRLGTPVLFCQERPGKDGKIFKMYKFRTMTDEKDKNGNLLSDEERLTEFGKKLRATSLDELPELFNILKGDMAIVGPRPLLVQYLPLYNEHQKRRHEVRPGFTGLAQINGRNAISWEQKFDYDIAYVDSIRFRKDWEIIFKTIKSVIKQEGISSQTSATMEAFMGNE